MEREVLIDEIIDFCFKYDLFDKSVIVSEIKNRIGEQLKESAFIENLINTIVVKTRKRNKMGNKKIRELLLELERLRLELEYQDTVS